jgi:hypothetical protein
MRLTRREWLRFAAFTATTSVARLFPAASQNGNDSSVTRQIANVIREYEEQGFHRTATTADQVSGDWLAGQVRQAGLVPALEPFPLMRVDLVTNALIVADRRIEGLALFDGTFTSASGVSGRLGTLETNSEIGLTQTAVNAAATGPLGEARRANRHKAIIAVTRGVRAGLCPSNADSFVRAFGPPVLQVSSEDASWITERAKDGIDVRVIAYVTRSSATANNVTAELRGTDPTLPPVVVMTPRSGWYACASERGGGIACWLEIMRGLRNTRLKQSVLFVASSGHELGHLGIDAYIDRRPGLVKNAAGWLHLGANIGAATDLNNNLLQASDDQLDAKLTAAMTASGLSVARRAPRGNVPAGEAEAVHRGGGRYVSAIGGNALFHNPGDRGSQAVDPITIAKFSNAFVSVASAIAGE